MNLPKFYLFSVLAAALFGLAACEDIIEPSISKSQVHLEAPTDQYLSTSYTLNFWWDEVDHALNYHLQVVTPSFAAPGSLVLDTIVTGYKFSYNLNPGTYQWRVMAENGSSQTAYSAPRTFTVAASSITQQQVQLLSPANNYLTNKTSVLLQWGNLYGATKYQIEIDTNNFVNESTVVLNQTIPGQQLNFTFPKDQNYQWRVRAENDTAQAQWSAISSVTFDNIPPAMVSLTSPANNLTVSVPVSLQWNATPTATNYRIYVFKSDSTTLYNSSFPIQVNSTSYSFGLGNSGDRIYWKVSALDAIGNEGQASVLRSFVVQ